MLIQCLVLEVLACIKSAISHHANLELHYSMADCDNLWLKIETPKSFNIACIIGIIYKHPNCNLDNFKLNFKQNQNYLFTS